jgi:hypothetical protein
MPGLDACAGLAVRNICRTVLPSPQWTDFDTSRAQHQYISSAIVKPAELGNEAQFEELGGRHLIPEERKIPAKMDPMPSPKPSEDDEDHDGAESAPRQQERPSSPSPIHPITIPTFAQEPDGGAAIRVKLPYKSGRTIPFRPRSAAQKADTPDRIQWMIFSLFMACCLMICLLLICLLLLWVILERVWRLTPRS